MNWLTKTFLVLLRLAIGWHFLVEGYEKIHSYELGPTTTSRPWTSEPYLREATGPLGDYFRKQIGDLDEAALDRLTLLPPADGRDPLKPPFQARFPAALGREWDDYFDHFVSHYRLSDAQVKQARAKLDQAKEQTAQWLLLGKKSVKLTFPSGVVERDEVTASRVKEYRDKLQAVNELQERKLPLFGRDVERERLRSIKAEVNRLRAELTAELNEETARMKQGLRSVLTPEQLAQEDLKEPAVPRPVERIDQVTRYGLTAVGACLLLGLFTRLACLGGAGFLLLFYLSMPPFPWLPENLRAEGHYLFVNKNLIEMLALLALATVPSGRWVGLDGLLRAVLRRLNPFKGKSE
jgi:uncharacterized membrane protein YphA (DoxX/SURF4 family)